jgi:hypothetical protein
VKVNILNVHMRFFPAAIIHVELYACIESTVARMIRPQLEKLIGDELTAALTIVIPEHLRIAG